MKDTSKNPQTNEDKMNKELNQITDQGDREGRTYELTYCLKYVAEGAASINELAETLESEGRWLRELALAGVVMTEPVDGGHAYFTTTDEEVARRFRMEVVDEFDDEDDLPGTFSNGAAVPGDEDDD